MNSASSLDVSGAPVSPAANGAHILSGLIGLACMLTQACPGAT